MHAIWFIWCGFEYHPGLLTSVILFGPATYMTIDSMLKSNRGQDSDLWRALLIRTMIDTVTILALVGAKIGYLSEGFVCPVLVLNILPLLIR